MTARAAMSPNRVTLLCLACFATFTGDQADERPVPGTRTTIWHCPECGSDHLDYTRRAYRRPDEGLH